MFARIDSYGITDIGQIRESNDDQYLVADLRKSVELHHTSLPYGDESELRGGLQGRLLLVADGVGGNAAGAYASNLAAEGVVQYLLNAMHWLHSFDADGDDDFLDDLKAAVYSSQQRIQHAAEDLPTTAGMATTITLAYLIWPNAYVVHVGDSRAYLIRGSELRLLTHDQTVAQELADVGLISVDQVDRHPFAHVLSSLVGTKPEQLNPTVLKAQLEDGDALLLCTDGLTRHLKDSQIRDVVAEGLSAEETCRRLIAMVNDAGGTDNTTVIMSRFAG
jgi:PPM family protein phosphatase